MEQITGTDRKFQNFVTANPGVNLTEVEKAIFDAFDMFEKDGFTEEDLIRIKARNETQFSITL